MPPRQTNTSKKAAASAKKAASEAAASVLDGLLSDAQGYTLSPDSSAPVSHPADSQPTLADSAPAVGPSLSKPTQMEPPAKKKKTTRSSSKASSSTEASSSDDLASKRKVAVPRVKAKDHEKVAHNVNSLKNLSSTGVMSSVGGGATKNDLGEDLMFVQRTEQIKSLVAATTYKLEADDSEAVKIEKIRANSTSMDKAWGFMEKNMKVALDYSDALNTEKVLAVKTARETLVSSHEKSKNDSFKITTSKMLVDLAHGNSSDVISMGTGTSAVFVAKTVSNIISAALPPSLLDEMNDPEGGKDSPAFEDITDSQYEY